MFHTSRFSAYFGLAAFAALFAAPGHATEYCDTRLRLNCTQGCYVYSSPIFDAECDKTAMIVTRDAFDAPPANPTLQCSRSGDGYRCEAWPQSEQISYAWSSYEQTVVTDVLNPYQFFGCSGGDIGVAVIGPGGGASVTTLTLPACN
jgi:hypothetical protein